MIQFVNRGNKLKKLLLVACVAFAVTPSFAQKKADAPPQKLSMKDVCLHIEASIVEAIRAHQRLSDQMPTAKNKEQVVEIMEIQNSYKRGRLEDEQSWLNLGCTQILFGPEKR